MKRPVMLLLEEEDAEWLEKEYGKDWIKRLEQHIHNEVHLRQHDALKMRKPWDY